MKENPLFQTVLEKNPDPIYFKDRDAKYIAVSSSMLAHLKSENDKVHGKSDFDVFPEEEAQEMYEEDIRVMQNREPLIDREKKITWPDGVTQWLSVHKFPHYDSENKVVGTFGVLRDITEHKKIEKEFQNVKKQALLMAEKSGKVIGSKITSFLSDDNKEEFRRNVEKAIETEKAVEFEHKWKSNHWLSSILTPIPSPDTEEIEDILVISRDITRTKEAEERQEFLHSLLRHDVRNKIQIIQGYLQFLEDTDLSKKQQKYLKKSIKASRNGFDLIEEVRALRKTKKDQNIIEINVGAIISKVIEENRDRAEEKQMKIQYEREDIKVEGGPLLRDLFENLFINAIQHSEGQVIKVRVREKEEKALITVEDDGKGIPDKNKDKIFDRSWSGKNSRGSGLGLHLVKRIAETYGGTVKLKDSKLGGARFDTYLKKMNSKTEKKSGLNQ